MALILVDVCSNSCYQNRWKVWWWLAVAHWTFLLIVGLPGLKNSIPPDRIDLAIWGKLVPDIELFISFSCGGLILIFTKAMWEFGLFVSFCGLSSFFIQLVKCLFPLCKLLDSETLNRHFHFIFNFFATCEPTDAISECCKYSLHFLIIIFFTSKINKSIKIPA